MSKLRVLVGVQPPLYSDLLERQLESEPSLTVVGHARSQSETLLMAGKLGADVVLLPGQEDDSVPGLCSHLFNEFPEIMVIAIAPSGDHAMLFQQTISAVRVERLADHGLASALNRDWTHTGP